MRESDIIHENGNYWIMRKISRNEQIAPLGSVYYQLFRVNGTHSVNDPFYVSANLERAKAVCDKFAARGK